jgi:hypothetical protein
METILAENWLHQRLDADPALAALAPAQKIIATGTGGTFTLTYGAQTTAPIAYGTPPIGIGSVQAALEALSTIGAKNTLVRSDAAQSWVVTFIGTLTNVVTPITGSGAGLTGPGAGLAISQIARIAIDTAPQGTPFPYVLAGNLSAQDVSKIGAIRIMVDCVYVVRGVIAGQVYSATLTSIADRVDTLIHRQSGPIAGGGSIVASYREQIFRLPEVASGVQYRHLGGTYKLLVQS